MSETEIPDPAEEVARIAERYGQYLAGRQTDASPADIRARVLAMRTGRVAIGFAQRNLMTSFAAGLSRLFPRAVGLRGNPEDWERAELFLCSGAIHPDSEHSHPGATRIFGDESIPDDRILLFEMGFLASAYSWSHGLRQGMPEAQCLGYVFDDVAHYYMADYPNRLIDRLNSNLELTGAERDRAEALIARIVEQRISKYNAQPMQAPEMTPGYTRRVLVCDQSYADASTVYGRIDERGFQDMLVAAIAENPDAEIIVKTHPDTTWEAAKRTGYYTHLTDYENVRILRDPVNPFVLFEHVDTVYAGTSQIGLEALFAGKKVVTFGAPFYAGWGLTDDRQEIPHRTRSRSLADLFDAFYVWYTIYHVPGCPVPSRIEDALDYIEEHRPVTPLPVAAAENPRVSVILPIYGVEAFVEASIRSVQRQTLREIEIIAVVDASPDRSLELVEALAETDARIRVVNLTENVGQGFARNRGLELAHGDYVWFLDADDCLYQRDFLEQAVARADRDNADMVRGRKAFERVIDSEGRVRNDRPDDSERQFEGLELSGVAPSEAPAIAHSRHFWLWLYRREFLSAHDIRFRTRNWEERAFLTRALISAERLSVMDVPAVVYFVREESTARRPKTLADTVAMISNLGEVSADLVAAGADDPDSPLHGYYRFNLTQFVHYICLGFPYRVLVAEATEAERKAQLARAAEAFRNAGFTPDRLTDAPDVVSAEDWQAGRYHLMLAALLDERPGLLRAAVDGAPVALRVLAESWRSAPDSDLSQALNRYASHGNVTLARPAAAVDLGGVRLILHIGSTKAGSTYLQHWLDLNRPALLAQGIYVPEVGLFRQPGRPHKTAGHAEFSVAANRGTKALRHHIAALIEQANGAIHTVILSSEAFFLVADPQALCDYFLGFRREMLVYLRPQDDWANSQYCEFVGGGAIRRTSEVPSDWLQSPDIQLCLDYAGKLDRWAEVLGRGQITVRPFEPAQFEGGSLLADFARAAGVAGAETLPDVPDALRNDAQLPGAYLEAMRGFNALPFPDTASYLRFTQAVQDIAAADPAESAARPEMLGPEVRAELRDAAQAGNDRVARQFLHRPEGGLFQTPPRDVAPPATGSLPAEAVAAMLDAYRTTTARRRHRPRPGAPAETGAVLRRKGLRAYARLARDYVTLMRSSLFDADAYRQANPDVAASRIPAGLHFLLYGGPEGRNPGPGFDTRGYYRNNGDVKASGENALVHYIRHGRKEGRRF